MKYLSLLTCVLSLTLLSCKVQSNDLIGKWTHAREKDHDGLQIYIKGENPDLPPARFRQVYVFQKNQECKYTYLSAVDKHALVDGTYLVKNDRLTIKNLSGDEIFIYRIQSAKAEEIWLEKL